MLLFESRASIILYNVLKTLDIKGKVLLPLNVCPILPSTLLKLKLEFEFIDIDKRTLCINENEVIKRFKNDSSIVALLFVHTFGIEINVDTFFKKLKEINQEIFIIDDRCLMIPNFDVDIESSFADLFLYSTGYSKYIDLSWGGFAFLKEKYLYKRNLLEFREEDLEEFSKQIQKCIDNESFLKYKDSSWLGSNTILYYNFNKYKAVIKEKTKLMKEHKKKLNKIYNDNLSKEIFLGDEFNNWRFSILVDDKERLLDKIFGNKLFASSHYKETEFMFKKSYSKNTNVRLIHKNIINLFNDFRFDEEKAFKVVNIINKHIQG